MIPVAIWYEYHTSVLAVNKYSRITMLTLILTRKLIAALEPIEEITKMLFTDAASISVQIYWTPKKLDNNSGTGPVHYLNY